MRRTALTVLSALSHILRRLLSALSHIFLAGLVLTACNPSTGQGPDRPNLLVIVTDDQRADGTMQMLPTVRRYFEQEGTRFRNSFTAIPLCCPARASIFTGRYAHNHGVHNNYMTGKLDESTTVQRHLQDAGYTTSITGKFLNQWPPKRDPDYFDRWAIFLEGEYYDRQWNMDGDVAIHPEYTNDILKQKTIEFLDDFESDDDKPWFMYVGTSAAHAPFTPEPLYSNADVGRWKGNPAFHEEDTSDHPSFIVTEGRRRFVRRNQLRTLMSVDDLVELLVQKLTELGELDDTLAIFTSDNGMQWGEHGFTGKRLPYTPSVRVPLYVRWPGRLGAGDVDSRLVANVDLAPSLLDAAEARAPSSMDGRSFFSPDRRKLVFIEHWRDRDTTVPDWALVRTRTEHYVEFYRRDRTIFREYFDVTQDPWQLHNLLGDDSKANDPPRKALSRRLARLRTCRGSVCP
jgi:arylsulfatase A-like enzyme